VELARDAGALGFPHLPEAFRKGTQAGRGSRSKPVFIWWEVSVFV